MNDEKLINDAIEYIDKLFRTNAGGHDAAHSLRVYKSALQIAEKEPACDLTIVSLAALLHDVDDHKLFDTRNNANARSFLETHRVAEEKIEKICAVINSVSFSQNRGKRPETIEGRIVQDADRLDALGAIGIARTFAYGGEHGRSIDESVQHFYDKLLLIKDELNTDAAKGIAGKRHAFLETYLAEFKDELGVSMMRIDKADYEDLKEILDLQYLAYQSEAALFGSNDIPPLKQTIEEVKEEFRNGLILKMTSDDGCIIGSVRAKEDAGTVYIGKLMVHPDYRLHGYGTRLLTAIEDCFPNKRFELFTSTRSVNNIRLYQSNGYRKFKQKTINDDLIFVFMEKAPEI